MNKTIFITGAAKRIGKAIALTFKDLGGNILKGTFTLYGRK